MLMGFPRQCAMCPRMPTPCPSTLCRTQAPIFVQIFWLDIQIHSEFRMSLARILFEFATRHAPCITVILMQMHAIQTRIYSHPDRQMLGSEHSTSTLQIVIQCFNGRGLINFSLFFDGIPIKSFHIISSRNRVSTQSAKHAKTNTFGF